MSSSAGQRSFAWPAKPGSSNTLRLRSEDTGEKVPAGAARSVVVMFKKIERDNDCRGATLGTVERCNFVNHVQQNVRVRQRFDQPIPVDQAVEIAPTHVALNDLVPSDEIGGVFVGRAPTGQHDMLISADTSKRCRVGTIMAQLGAGSERNHMLAHTLTETGERAFALLRGKPRRRTTDRQPQQSPRCRRLPWPS